MSEGISGLAEEPIYDKKLGSIRPLEKSDGSHLEDGLHLGELGPRMFSRKHFHNQAANTPNIGFLCVASLFDNLWCHPENRALQRWSVDAISSKEFFER